MDILTLEELKQQVRVDYEVEDDLLETYGTAAETNVIQATNRTVDELTEMGGGVFPVPLRVAMLKMAAELFTYRGITTQGNVSVVPYGYEALIRPYVRLKER